jgi:hypothetical protein
MRNPFEPVALVCIIVWLTRHIVNSFHYDEFEYMFRTNNMKGLILALRKTSIELKENELQRLWISFEKFARSYWKPRLWDNGEKN